MAGEYYIARGGKNKQGPYSSKQLKELAGSGRLMPTDLVWKEGFPKWVEANQIKGLFNPTLPVAHAPPDSPFENIANHEASEEDDQQEGEEVRENEEHDDLKHYRRYIAGAVAFLLVVVVMVAVVQTLGKHSNERNNSQRSGMTRAEWKMKVNRLEGRLQPQSKKTWATFRIEYAEKSLSLKAAGSGPAVKAALDHFQRIIRPVRMEAITTQTIDDFIAKRRKDRGKKPGSLVSPATINKDLRHIKAALRKAQEWGYLHNLPRIHMVREPGKLPRYVTPEHFALMYEKACSLAKKPAKCDPTYTAQDFWRALVVAGYMAGLRINEILSLKKDDLDPKRGSLITRWADNKGQRDEVMTIHDVVVQHLRKIIGQRDLIFLWGHDSRELWDEFGRIQKEAGIHLPCCGDHEHTAACHVYGFHDLRRAFATVNAPRMKPEILQKLMRHKSYQTTMTSYINPTSQVEDAVKTMPIPEVLKKAAQETGNQGDQSQSPPQ